MEGDAGLKNLVGTRGVRLGRSMVGGSGSSGGGTIIGVCKGGRGMWGK